MLIAVLFLSSFLTACATDKFKKGEAHAKLPINCPHAEGDIRVLESEKAHAEDQMAAGVGSVVPIALFSGVVTGTAGTKARVATGDYNKMLDKKIAEIKKTCGI